MKKTFTFLEILVSALILAIGVAGLLVSFVASRKAVKNSQIRLEVANWERKALDKLYAKVKQGAPFSCNSDCSDLIDLTSLPSGFTCTCNINNNTSGNFSQVDINIDYQPAED